jgi:signal transduction histidine kinase
MKFGTTSIRAHVLAWSLVSAVALIALGAFGAANVLVIERELRRLTTEVYGASQGAKELEINVHEVAVRTYDYVSRPDPELRRSIEADDREFRAAYARGARVSDSRLAGTYEAYKTAASFLLDLRDGRVAAPDPEAARSRFASLRQQLDDLLDEGLQRDLDLRLQVEVARVGRRARLASIVGVLVTVLVAVAGVLASYLVTSRLAGSLRHITSGTDAVARGERDFRFVVEGRNELATLASRFNLMADRLAESEDAKASFLATVSHELRTPLTAVYGMVGLLRSGLAEPDEAQRLLEIGQLNCERLIRLINDLLDVDRGGTLTFDIQPQSLARLVAQAISVHETYAAVRGIRIRGEGRTASTIEVDEGRFQQVMSNLIANAVKFSSEGAEVVVTTELRDGWAQIAVHDRGRGIPASFHVSVFERFMQAESGDARREGGVGLGLALAKQLVVRMGGRIGFTSEVGVGTTFTVEFPSVAAGDG